MKKKILSKVDKFKKIITPTEIANKLIETQTEASTLSKKIRNTVEITKQYTLHPTAPFALVFNVAPWKRGIVRSYLTDYKLIFVALNENLKKYESLVSLTTVVVIVWGRATLAHIKDFSLAHNLPIYHLEDGFIRSIGLGANHVPPMSICFDKTGLYFDATRPSDLENLLNTYDFEKDIQLMLKAEKLINEIKLNNITKYNLPDTSISNNVYGPKVKPRILVIGQVEDDQSLIYGCQNIPSNLDLIKLAVNENPNAQIIYKKHPDILYGKRKELSDITEVSDYIDIININMSLVDALNQVDRVYTMTSLAGFEALIHGIPVTTLGAPFYSGWALTDDRFSIARRNRQLSLVELFAAAYILYPRYRSADGLSKSSLEKTIEYISNNKQQIQAEQFKDKFDYLSFYNAHTLMRVDNRLITNLGFEKLAIISDSSDSLEIAESIAEAGKMKVTLFTTRDQLANDESMINSSSITNDAKKVHITSLHKHYSVPLSAMEKETVKITSVLAKSLEVILNRLFSDFHSKDILHYISLGIIDYCYFETLRFLSIGEILDEFESVLIYLENIDLNHDIFKSIKYHGEQKEVNNKVFLSVEGRSIKDLYLENDSIPISSLKIENADVKSLAARFWYDMSDKRFHSSTSFNNVALICGNVQNDNYAYSPATKKIIEVVNQKHKGESLFFSSSFTHKTIINDFKKDFLDTLTDCNTKVYNLTNHSYIEKYGKNYTKYNVLFESILPGLLISEASAAIPLDLLNLLNDRILFYCKSIQTMMAFTADVDRLTDHTSVFFTSMERATVSKIITAICKEKNIPTVGIQPQIISMSKRYYSPAVDKMGVIDESQKEILKKFGYDTSKTYNVGAVNIINRLIMMQEYSHEKETYDVFFAMQHSVQELMMPVIEALKIISEKYNLKIIIKPHPHQEIPIYYKVRSDFADSNNIKVLSRESDTYLWLARSKTVVGMFSSVLLEAACFGKDVVVAAFDDLDDSINMSRQGIALNASNPFELEDILLDLLNKTGQWEDLRKSRENYLIRNPQFSKPYNTRVFEEFISSNIPFYRE